MLFVHAADTPRTRYVVDLLFAELLGLDVRFVPSTEEPPSPDQPSVFYGAESHEGGLLLPACGLLDERSLTRVEPKPTTQGDQLVLFPVHGDEDCSFDLLAAAFYLVSRYEEYLVAERDEHGRFRAEDSVLFQSGFLRRPVVNEYARLLARLLEERYPRLPMRGPVATAHSTIDIDIAFAFRGRGFVRTLGAGLRNPATLPSRMRVLLGKEQDPFDTFDWLQRAHSSAGVPATFFILLREGRGVDRSIAPDGKPMASLVRDLARNADVGMHPSYASNRSLSFLREEHGRLSYLVGRGVSKSRQHYLKFDLPHTYRHLIELGITDDFSMGYASEPGFRAGIASPYPYYDLEKDERTALTVHPITYMDGTLRHYQNLSPEEAITVIDDLAAAIRDAGGCFLSLWHNDSVAEQPPWIGWRKVFEHSLAAAEELCHSR